MTTATLVHVAVFSCFLLAGWVGSIVFLPPLLLVVFKRAILGKGFGEGPIPINTLGTEPLALFADPLHPPPGASALATTGVNRDTLLTVGWLDLGRGPLVLQVPEMSGRYYSVQLTNPATNTNFAYVGTRATGTGAGQYLLSGPSWRGQPPSGMAQIRSPSNSVLMVGRVLVKDERDLTTAHGLTRQIRITPLSA